jgi:hypothetical protein
LTARRRLLRIGLALGGGSCGLTLAALLGGGIWLTTPGGNDFLRGVIEDQVSDLMPLGELRIGTLRSDLFTHVELSDVTLHRWDGDTMLTVPRIRLDYKLPRLAQKSVPLQRLQIESPDLRMEQQLDGQIDLLIAFGVTDEPSTEPPSAWSGLGWLITLEDAALTDGRVTWVSGETEQVVEDVSLHTALSVGGGRYGSLTDLKLHAAPVGYAPVDATGDIRYETGNLLIDTFDLKYDLSEVGITGTIHQVELDLALGLQVSLKPLAAGQLSQWTNDQTPKEDLTAELSVRGPLSDIAITGEVTSESAGKLGVKGTVDVTAEPMAWSLTADTERLDLDALLPPVTEPVQLIGQYSVSGTGTSWPDGIVARIDVKAKEQVLWGEPVSGLTFGGDLAGGRLTVEHLTANHPVGTLGLTGGWVDITGETASLEADVSLPELAALSRYQLPGYRGSLSAVGPVEVDWSGEVLRVDVFPILSGRNISGDGFGAGTVSSQALQVTLTGEDVSFGGGLGVEEIDVAGLKIDRVDLSKISGSWSSARGVSFDTEVAMGRMLVGDGTFELSGLTGPVGGSVPPNGELDITTELMLGELMLLPADYKIDGGPVSIKLKDGGIEVGLSLSREERVVIEAKTYGDFDSGKWRVEELALFPISGRGMVSVQETPIRFTLNDDNVDDVELVLVISEERTYRSTSLEGASYIAMSGGTGGAEPDLNLTVGKLPLAWVSDVLNTFLSEKEKSFVAIMEGAVDGEVSLKGLSGDAALSGNMAFTDFTLPEVVQDVGIKMDFSGTLSQPGAEMRLSDSDGLLLALEGSVPLDLDLGSLDCNADIALRGLLAPGELTRLESAFPAAVGAYGLGSADVHLTGPACDPHMTVVGALSLPVGAQGEHMRVDLHMKREGEIVEVTATADENMLRRFKLSGTANNRFSEVLAQALSGEGAAPDYADPQTWVSEVNLNLVPLAVPLESLTTLFNLPGGITGRLAGGVSLSGSLDKPQVSGGLLWVEGRIGDVPLQLANLNLFPETNLKTEKEGYRLMGAMDFGGEGYLSVDGFLPLTLARFREDELIGDGDEGALSVKLEGREVDLVMTGKKRKEKGMVPLAVLNGVIDGLSEASGQLVIDGNIAGTASDPRPNLSVGLLNGALAYRPLGIRYSDINIDVYLSKARLEIRQLKILSEPLLNTGFNLKNTVGTLSGSGSVKMAPKPQSALVGLNTDDFWLNSPTSYAAVLELDADDFWLTATPEYTAAVQGQMTVGGTMPTIRVAGDLSLSEGRFSFDDSFFMDNEHLALDSTITVYRQEEILKTVVEVREPSEFEKRLVVELGMDLNRNLRMAVDMPLLDTYGGQISSLSTVSILAEMDGMLDVAYRGGALSINGTVETLAGSTTRLFDTSFALADGSAVYFVGDDYANPILKLTAVHTNTRYGDVNVDINGSADQPEVAFSADEYDETDILFLLLFGKPASEMSEGESSAGSLLLSTAVASLSGQVSRAVGGTIIDEFDWDPDSGVRIGKALSEKLFLAYDRNSNPEDDENINQLTLEWIISRRMYAQFMTGDMAQSSADLYWRWLF